MTSQRGAISPQVVQQDNGSPYTPINFGSNFGGFGHPDPVSAVRAADGYVYFEFQSDQGPAGTAVLRVANDTTVSLMFSQPYYAASNLTADSLGDVWFFDPSNNALEAWKNMHMVHSYRTPGVGSIAAGSDGNIYTLYVGASNVLHLLRTTQTGTMTDVALPITASNAPSITNGPDGNLWAPLSVNGAGYAYKITYSGSVTRYALPDAGASRFTVANGYLWYLATAQSAPTLYRIAVSGATQKFVASAGQTCSSCGQSLTAGTGALWFMSANGVIAFDLKSNAFSAPIQTNLSDNSPFVAASGSDGNVWAAVDAVDANGNATGSVILAHVLQASPTSLTVQGQQNITVTETGSCSAIQATSSNTSIATVAKTGSSCNQATFTVSGNPNGTGGSCVITFFDSSFSYKSNRVTVPVTVQTTP